MKSLSFLIILAGLMTVSIPVIAQSSKSFIDTAFEVQGVCDMCKHRIEDAAKIKGVQSAVWNIDTKMLSIRYNASQTSLEKINKKIAGAGHDTYLMRAKDAAYHSLPECCHHRELKQFHEQHPMNSAKQYDGDSMKGMPSQTGDFIKGVVVAEDNKGTLKPLAGASVVWLETGSGTATDENGVFNLKYSAKRIVVSYAGYQSDTISVEPMKELKIILATNKQLKEVKVTSSRASRFINSSGAFRTETITQKELLKAACCNLSESFETNPSVDVSYSDAVTGSKQIQLLGLAGIYTQLTVENLPGPRGLSTSLGLNSIPGTWIESLQLSKGTGSVANGFESIAGQINVELQKPVTADRLYANVYANDFGKTDLNLNLSQKMGSRWSTILLLHDAINTNKKLDFNKDGFRDLPTGNLFSAANIWNYSNNKGITSEFGIKYLNDNKTGGQVGYNAATDKFTTNNYGLEINTKRAEAFAKIGYVFPQKVYQSIGLQVSAFNHKQDSYFGMTNYDAQQQNFYSNLIYQSIINTTAHKLRTGASFVYDNYNEVFKTDNYKRKELVPGAFFEYTFTPSDKLNMVAGIRADHNSLYGWFASPKLNVRYEPVEGTNIRFSIGRGQRTANIFAENNSVFVSSRQVRILTSNAGGANGLAPEAAWNKGISIDQKFKLFHRAATFGIDFFRNDFTNQVVVDLEDPRAIKFYNLQGKSYSNSLQSEISFIPVKRFDVKLAYRLFDVKTTYSKQLLPKPLTSQNRAFANLAYEISGWKFDYTISYSGRKRLPSTTFNPEKYQLPSYSPDFTTMNAQITKVIGKKYPFEVYFGGENLTNYFQKNAIVAASEPFSQYFDASMVWGPLSGRMFYGGVRYRVK